MNADIKTNIQSAYEALTGPLADYMCGLQRKALITALNDEGDGEGHAEAVLRTLAIIEAAPVTYKQDGLGDKAVAHLHYFIGDIDAWITELDMDGGVQQAFGLQCIDGVMENAELGYISIVELTQNNALLDLYFTPNTLEEIKASR